MHLPTSVATIARHPVEQERRDRKKNSHNSSKTSKPQWSNYYPPMSQSATIVHPQSLPPVSQANSTQYLQPYQSRPQSSYDRQRPPASDQNSPFYPEGYQTIPYPSKYPGTANTYHLIGPYVGQSPDGHGLPPPSRSRDGRLRTPTWDSLDSTTTKPYSDIRGGASKSVTGLASNCIEKPAHALAMMSMQALCQGAALCDTISAKFDAIITSMDDDSFSGKEQDLMIFSDERQHLASDGVHIGGLRGRRTNEPLHRKLGNSKGWDYSSKVWLYSNARLEPHLPPFKVYMPTYPLLCLAATYSDQVYDSSKSKANETKAYISSDWRNGTKAMVLKSLPVDDMNTVVFAIRGSQMNFMDWAVNYNTSPTSPEGFLDDATNLCHAGFLYVAKKMFKPVADRLRVLLEENPARSNCSLLITGHSAGGAVAALLYAHMMSTKIESELSYLTGFFKRVHCITFGAPPVSIRPLQKSKDNRHRKSLFFSFINEGDPITRADTPYIKSLAKLYCTPAPNPSAVGASTASMSSLNLSHAPPSGSKLKSKVLPSFTKPSKSSLQVATSTVSTTTTDASRWPIPAPTLSPAGRLVVLRARPGSSVDRKGDEVVEAVTVDEQILRGVVYGDLMKHQMTLYRKRIEEISIRAVTGAGY